MIFNPLYLKSFSTIKLSYGCAKNVAPKNASFSISAITSPVDTFVEIASATSLVCAVVGADGATPTYAWYKVVDGAADSVVDGETGATYTISSPAWADNGDYYCQVKMTATVPNSPATVDGPFDSDRATLHVRGTILQNYQILYQTSTHAATDSLKQ